jgi:hypothetical protein
MDPLTKYLEGILKPPGPSQAIVPWSVLQEGARIEKQRNEQIADLTRQLAEAEADAAMRTAQAMVVQKVLRHLGLHETVMRELKGTKWGEQAEGLLQAEAERDQLAAQVAVLVEKYETAHFGLCNELCGLECGCSKDFADVKANLPTAAQSLLSRMERAEAVCALADAWAWVGHPDLSDALDAWRAGKATTAQGGE